MHISLYVHSYIATLGTVFVHECIHNMSGVWYGIGRKLKVTSLNLNDGPEDEAALKSGCVSADVSVSTARK